MTITKKETTKMEKISSIYDQQWLDTKKSDQSCGRTDVTETTLIRLIKTNW